MLKNMNHCIRIGAILMFCFFLFGPGQSLLAQVATIVIMPDLQIQGHSTGNQWGGNNLVGTNVIMLSNGGTTAYFVPSTGRLLQITNQSNQAFTFGSSDQDNTGILQDYEAKNTNWAGCGQSVNPINFPFDYCSITAYFQSTQPGSVAYRVINGIPTLSAVAVSEFEGSFDTSYDPQGRGGANFTFFITYKIYSDGVIRVYFNSYPNIANGAGYWCYDRWISFPFVLVSPYLYVADTQWAFNIGSDTVTGQMMDNDVFYSYNPANPAYSHQTFTLNNQPNCPRNGILGSPAMYSNVPSSLPNYYGIHNADNTAGILAKLPTNSAALVMYNPKQEVNGIVVGGFYEVFLETQVPISSWFMDNYAELVLIPWGGLGGISKATAESRLSGYFPSISNPSVGYCGCP